MSAQIKEPRPPRKAYSAPGLIRYGDVRTLTQSGPSGQNETLQMMGLMRMASSRHTKENIVRIGTHPLGIGLYLFDYKPEFLDSCGHGRQFGVMADEVETVMPRAVSWSPRGHKVVDYAMLGIWRASS